MNKKKYTNTELLEDLKTFCDKYEITPSCKSKEVKYGLKASIDTYKKRFGSWSHALNLIGKTTRPPQNKYTKKEMLQSLINFYDKEKRTPTYDEADYNNILIATGSTYKERFGSWNNALIEAGLDPNNVPPSKLSCKKCGKSIVKYRSDTKRSSHSFCSHKCASTYIQEHRTWGSIRSLLEKWLEEELDKEFPDLNIIYNDRKIMKGAELDILFPDIKVAIEINGIYHYKPIYGEERLKRTQKIDRRKKRVCKKLGINLHIFNVSKMKPFTEKRGEKYLEK